MDVAIRLAGAEALPHAQRIHDEHYVDTGLYDPVFSEYVARSITAFERGSNPATDRVWLAESGGQLVGYVAVCHTDGDDLQLRYLFVDASMRGQGLGRHMVELVVEHAQMVGASGIRLWTMEGLESARKIYESFGWMLTETAPAPWHDSLLQQRFDLSLSRPPKK